ncbi:MAG: CoA-binding protein [Candidatus Aenigmarchaeota archaeon]
MSELDYFFNPKTVAVIGASRDQKKIGHVIFRNFVKGKFNGKVFPVNPKTEKLLNIKCYKSVSKIKEKIDLAVVSIPAPVVPDVLEECGKKKVKACITVSGGFKEIGNIELEKKLKTIAKKHRLRIIGPNCLGVFDPYSGVDTIFNPRYKLERPGKGSIAFVSQSGATMSVILDWMALKGYKISKAISYGNGVDVDESDLIEHLAGDERTEVICLYIEGVRDGRKLLLAAKKTSPNKPIVALKGGVTEEGKKATTSHTGSLAGEVEIYKAAFKQSGIVEAYDLEQLFDFARVLSTQPLPKGNRVQIITDGGGFGVLMSDWVVKNKMKIAKMKKKSIDRIREVASPHAGLENFIDLTGDATTKMYKVSLHSAMEDENVDMIALITLFQPPMLTPDVVEVVIEAVKENKKPIIVIAAGGDYTEVLKRSMEENGVPCFSYPERAAEALRALYEYSNIKSKGG